MIEGTQGDSEFQIWDSHGEDPGVDFNDPFAKHANKRLKTFGESPSIVVPMGELGDIPAKDLRVWRSKNPGELIAFIRNEAGEHKVISTVVALGVVASAIGAVKYIKK